MEAKKHRSKAAYLRVRYRSNGEERYKSIIFGEGYESKENRLKGVHES